MAKRKISRKSKNLTSRKSPKSKQDSNISIPSPHSWRLCPHGEHWVTTHQLHSPPSEKNQIQKAPED
jgi:hypothetical protein